MPIDLFRGDLVRLTAEEPGAVAQAYAGWNLIFMGILREEWEPLGKEAG